MMTQQEQDQVVQDLRDQGIVDACAGLPPMYRTLNGETHYFGPMGKGVVTNALELRQAQAYIQAYEANY